MSLLSKFTKNSTKSPIKRLVDDVANQLEYKLENTVNDMFSKALKNSGLSSSVASTLSSRFGDSLKNDLADEYFRTSTSEVSRVTRKEICDSVFPRYAETTASSVERIDNYANVDGVKNTYQFPSQIGKYYMIMSFREYTRTAPQAKATMNFKNAIVLPIPKKLEESYDLLINKNVTGTVGGIADIIQSNFSDKSDSYNLTSSTTALAYSFLVQKLGDKINATDTIGQYLGSIPNPHLATIFNGVDMRSHRFEWTFSPRNAKESADLQKLITKLKQNSLPAFSKIGTAILEYPYLCQITLEPWESKGSKFMTFKPALLTNVTVNYSPNGIPSFFAGTNLPTFIQLSLDFTETEYFTAEDYGRGGSDNSKITDSIDYIKSKLGGEDVTEVEQINDALGDINKNGKK